VSQRAGVDDLGKGETLDPLPRFEHIPVYRFETVDFSEVKHANTIQTFYKTLKLMHLAHRAQTYVKRTFP
jgi:hypothetical protein